MLRIDLSIAFSVIFASLFVNALFMSQVSDYESTDVFADLLTKYVSNIKAEVLVDLFIDLGVPCDKIKVEFSNAFNRPFVSDVLQVMIRHKNLQQPEYLIRLSRDGIYDQLPESLFHKNYSLNHYGSLPIKKIVEQFKQLKIEEYDARRLFLPFEREFFLQKVLPLQKEKDLETDTALMALLIQKDLSFELAARFQTLLPVITYTAGNLSRIEKIIQYLFNEEAIIQQYTGCESMPVHNPWQLGTALINQDTIPGLSCNCPFPLLRVIINLKHHNISDFLPWKQNGKLLDLCVRYLFPFDVNVDFVFIKPEGTARYADDNYRIGFDLSI